MIVIRNLWKKYGKLQVLAGLDLDINTGETIVVLGRSGVGKSVLLKHIIGISKPDAGTIDIDGEMISELSGPALYKAVQHMGMLFQGAALFDSMNVEENTGFYLKQHGDPRTGRKYTDAEIKDLVANALEMVDLQGSQNKMPSELSGGMRKRAALARLIVYRPSLLLYDEPTTGLDPITAMQINALIVKTQRELKATSIVVTHDILSSLFVGDRLALIRDGKIAHIGNPETFMKIEDPIIDFLRKTITQDPRKLREAFNG
ncbi:MAG: ATP-binding cassette domain-containing protein [Chlamydiales bacterium]|nr:ATP-binding cassette domain-containing protein [Chlamydiales bacterium]